MSMSPERAGRFVLVLTLPETTQAAVDFLRVCAKLGILQRTAITDFRKASEQQGEAQAWHCKSDHTQSLSTVFNEQEVTAMSVLSLRPYGMTAEQYADEDYALQAIQNVLPTGLRNSLRLATVAPALPEGSAGDAPFSSYWDFHLVCDGRAASSGSQQSQTLDAKSDAALAQALLAGLSAVGGWNCPSEGFTEITPHDAGIMGVRFCHASMRVICSTHTDYGARSGVIPQSTPWPLPHGGNSEAATFTSVPPKQVAVETAHVMELICHAPKPSPPFKSANIKFWEPVPTAAVQSDTEKAMWGLLTATGFQDPNTETEDISVDYVAREQAMQAHIRYLIETGGIEAMEAALIESGVDIHGDVAAEAEKPTPKSWEALYQTCFSLVDGGQLPHGVERPQGQNSSQLVWLDTHKIIPPNTASSLTNSNEKAPKSYAYRFKFPINKPKSLAPASTEASASSEQTINEEQPKKSIPNDVPKTSRFPPPDATSSETPKSADKQETKPADQEPKTEHKEFQTANTQSGQFVLRLQQTLQDAVAEVIDNFCKHACLKNDEAEKYDVAIKAQRDARRFAVITAASLLIGLFFILDQRFSIINTIWQTLFGGNAPLRLYPPTSFPLVPLVVFGVLILVAIALLQITSIYKNFITAVDALELANYQRKNNDAQLLHYASEFLRMAVLVRQFADHQRVIARLLHEPFGDLTKDATSKEPDLSWIDSVTLPAGMLLGSASLTNEVSEEDREKLAQIFTTGWLTELHHEIKKAWKSAYQYKIVSGFELPEQDTSAYETVQHRHRQGKGTVFGARTDWVKFVESNEHGVTVAQDWVEKRLKEVATDAMAAHTKNLTSVTPYGGRMGWWPNAEVLLNSRVVDHSFDLSRITVPTAARPGLAATVSVDTQSAESADGEMLTMFQWELHITNVVAPQSLATYHLQPHSNQEQFSNFAEEIDYV